MSPETTPVRLVTVAREFGSGGSDLARALARGLGWSLLEDHEVVHRVAERLGAPVRDVEASDEHVATWAERVGRSLAGVFPEVVPPPGGPQVDPERVARTAEAVLLEAAAGAEVVLVGHGGMCLFRERDDALHVRVVADFEHRTSQVVRRLGLEQDAAREEIRARDADREAYIRKHFDASWADPTLYHVVINSARVGAERGAALVRSLMGRAG